MSLIEVANLTKSYGKDQNKTDLSSLLVLDNLDFKANAGDTCSIVGLSGAGKSTFLHILGALDRPTKGSVLFNGEPLFKKSDDELALFRNQNIGFIFQFHHLLPEFSALENVMMPALIGGIKREEAKEKANHLLHRVGLGERVNHKPGELSGGEQQRCAIVRALINSPSLILADEPTGNLDEKTGSKVFDILLELNSEQNTTMIMVTHNKDLTKYLKRNLKISNGRLEEIK